MKKAIYILSIFVVIFTIVQATYIKFYPERYDVVYVALTLVSVIFSLIVGTYLDKSQAVLEKEIELNYAQSKKMQSELELKKYDERIGEEGKRRAARSFATNR